MPRRLPGVLLALAVSAFATPAGAESAVLYVPDEDVELSPLSIGDCTAQTNSGAGCDNLPEVTVVSPHPDALTLRTDLAAALAPYDVHIAQERPPPYLAYTMLMPSVDPEPRSESYSCSSGGINCSALKRNDIIRVFGPTLNCAAIDLLRTSVYAFGRASGLEGVTEPTAAMLFPPDFTMGTGMFVDMCMPIANQLGTDMMGEQIELPLECTQFDHIGCAPGQQNSHVDLIDAYGTRVVDNDPPELSNLVPGNGALLPAGFDLELDVTITDTDPNVGGRWTIYSRELEAAGVPDGTLTFCTNDVCDANWPDASPLKPTDSDWHISIVRPPPGIYEITFEASDFHGNVAEPAVMVFEIGEIPEGTTTDDPDTGNASTLGSEGTTTDEPGSTSAPPPLDSSGSLSQGDSDPDPGSDADTGDTAGQDDGLIDQGCACRSTSGDRWGAAALWLVLVGLRRQRRSAA